MEKWNMKNVTEIVLHVDPDRQMFVLAMQIKAIAKST